MVYKIFRYIVVGILAIPYYLLKFLMGIAVLICLTAICKDWEEYKAAICCVLKRDVE